MTKAQVEAEKIASKIAENYNPEKIYLFGSVSRGTENDASDIDLLIIKNTDEKRPFRTRDVFRSIRGLDRSRSIDPIVYTQEEFDKRVDMGDFFAQEVLSKGKLVYGQ